MSDNSAREEILGKARSALGRRADSPIKNIPTSARIAPRQPGNANTEMEMLLSEITKLGGNTRRLQSKSDFETALRELVQVEGVKKATVSCTRDLEMLGIEEKLTTLGVDLVSPHADKYALAECDLGVTSVDAALPETGTLVLRSSPDRPRMISLMPRVHLALLHPSALRADLTPVFAENKSSNYFVFITGPSRTSDIELTLTIGVHGPKSLHVWVTEQVENS